MVEPLSAEEMFGLVGLVPGETNEIGYWQLRLYEDGSLCYLQDDLGDTRGMEWEVYPWPTFDYSYPAYALALALLLETDPEWVNSVACA